MFQNENTINNDLGKNILIFLLIVFVGYLLYCEYKNKENFKKLKENMTNVEKFTGGEGITESIKNLGLLASKIQGADGVLDLTGIDLKVNKLEATDNIKSKNFYIDSGIEGEYGQLFWNNNIDGEKGIEISSRGADCLRLFTGNDRKIDIRGDKIEIYKNIHFKNENFSGTTEREFHFQNGSVIKEYKDEGLELWPKKKVKEEIKNGSVNIKVDNGENTNFPNHQSIYIIPGEQKIKYNLGSVIKEWPHHGIELWARNKNGTGSTNISFPKTHVRFEEESNPKYIWFYQTNNEPMFHKWAHFQNIGWKKKHDN